MNITNNHESVPIAEFKRIGYFEAWNVKERPCLKMDISKMPATSPPGADSYSHVHFAFPDIKSDFSIDVSKFPDQFEGLKKLANIKRIVSFGGWSFSNDNPTYQMFRNIVATEDSRRLMANNVANFVVQNGLDGVDFDWEYPGVSCLLVVYHCLSLSLVVSLSSPQTCSEANIIYIYIISGHRYSRHSSRWTQGRSGLSRISKSRPGGASGNQVSIHSRSIFVLVSSELPHQGDGRASGLHCLYDIRSPRPVGCDQQVDKVRLRSEMGKRIYVARSKC